MKRHYLAFYCILAVLVMFKKQLETWALLCNSSYRYPADCYLQDCEYQIRWSVQKDTGEVSFHIIAHVTANNMWTGVGFNTKPVMDNADLVLGGYMDNGTFVIHDMSVGSGYNVTIDTNENIYETSSVLDNETTNKTFLMIKFKRKLDTLDQNQDKSLLKCVKFLYPISPGTVDANGGFTKHTLNPLVSQDDMCLATCTEVAAATTMMMMHGAADQPLNITMPLSTPASPFSINAQTMTSSMATTNGALPLLGNQSAVNGTSGNNATQPGGGGGANGYRLDTALIFGSILIILLSFF